MVVHESMNSIHLLGKNMRRMPNFVLLRAFESAARLESFALAAQELHLTPSAISHQVKELEAYFGRPLFLRRNRRVVRMVNHSLNVRQQGCQHGQS